MSRIGTGQYLGLASITAARLGIGLPYDLNRCPGLLQGCGSELPGKSAAEFNDAADA